MPDRRKPDHYTDRAKRAGYAARSVYKLQEIQQRFALLAPGNRVLDLGAAPGSWSQYAAKIVGPRGRVVAVDLSPMETSALPEWVETIAGDMTDQEIIASISSRGPFQVVLCDAAPATTGNRIVDTARSAALVETAFFLAEQVLAPGGAAVAKVFEGGDVAEMEKSLRPRYAHVRRIRPKATRKESIESFIVAGGFQG